MDRRKNRKYPFAIIIILSVIVFGIFAANHIVNDLYLEIALEGGSSVTVEYGSEYMEPGAKLWLMGKKLFPEGMELKDVVIESTGIVEEKLGLYPVTYRSKFLFWTAEAERKVSVIDTQAPVILLSPQQESEENWKEGPEYQAVDNHDGDITERVVRNVEAYVITFAVTDSSGNPAYAVWQIPELPPESPQIDLVDGNEYSITVGHKYEEPGYAAADTQDGDLTASVIAEGEVDWMTPGIYPIVYRVTDRDGNEDSITRNVEVKAKAWPDTQWPDEKTIYLTFDDGPGPYTLQLLDILERYGVRATFFVVDSEYRDLMKEIVKRGHSIGIHSVSHNYQQIYSSPEAYFEDLFAMQQIIYENTGVVTTLMRFPGGGSNLVSKRTAKGIMSVLTKAVQDAGFQYFDWNVDSDDAGKANKTRQVTENVIRGIEETGISMVLQHDIHPYSVDAVEEIILWGLDNGYTFQAVRNSTPGFHHDILN